MKIKQAYSFEPSNLEVALTECAGKLLLRGYYSAFVNKLDIGENHKVLDYCCGNGTISKMAAGKLRSGKLVYADVSSRWLEKTKKKLKGKSTAKSCRLRDFEGLIDGGGFDREILHFSLHDFPGQYAQLILCHLAKNLKPGGTLHICEPLSEEHGIPLPKLIDLIEATGQLTYEYALGESRLTGRYTDISCRLK